MTVRQLRQLLFKLEDQEAIISLASDEEGNSYGDVDTDIAESTNVNGKKEYSLYPTNAQMAEDRFK
jgi:hypothetical protein